jgi:hypothetical protein
MQVTESEDFERPALTWLFREGARLARALDDSDLSSDEARRVVEAFLFGLCAGLDDEPVVVGGSSYRPAIVMMAGDRLLAAEPSTFAWHEYALSIVGEVFDDV